MVNPVAVKIQNFRKGLVGEVTNSLGVAVSDLKAQADTALQNQFDQITSLVETTASDLKAHAGSLFSAGIVALGADIAVLKTDFNGGIFSVEEDVAAVQASLNSTFNSGVSSMRGDLHQLQTRMDSRIDCLKSHIDESIGTLSSDVERDMADLREEISGDINYLTRLVKVFVGASNCTSHVDCSIIPNYCCVGQTCEYADVPCGGA